MSAFYLVTALVTTAALAWMLRLVLRTTGGVSHYAITGLVVLWVASVPFGIAGSGGLELGALDRLDARVTEYLLRVAATYCLVVFFHFTVGPRPRAGRAARRQAIPPLVVGVVTVVAAATVPAGLRDATAALATASGAGPTGVTSSVLVYLPGNLYFGFAFGTALVWVHRHRPGAQQPLRRGLAVVEVGLALLVVSTAFLVVSNVVRWTGTTPSPLLGLLGVACLLPGLVVFLAGMLYPSFATARSVFGIWREHRRVHRELGPLWQSLHAAFPQDSFESKVTWADRLGPGGVHRRYYRRVVECRDGLVRLSPYLDTGGAELTAEHVHRALAAARTSENAPTTASVLAPPTGASLADDVEGLVLLSRRLGQAPDVSTR